jgi:hypothetical protein
VWQAVKDPRRVMRRHKGRYIGTFYHYMRIFPRVLYSRIWVGGKSHRRLHIRKIKLNK